MKRTLAWLVTLGFSAGAWCSAADNPLPRIVPVERMPFAQKKDADNAKNSKDAKNDKDTKDKDTKDTKDAKSSKDEKEEKNGKNGKSDPAPTVQQPNLWPNNPFPPAAPPVLDPRTGAWEQVTGPTGAEVSDGGIYPPPGPDGVCTTGAISQLQPPVAAPGPAVLTPVSGVMPAAEAMVPTPARVAAPAEATASRGGIREWLERLRNRPRTAQREQRERTLNISKNWETGSWEIEEVSHRPR